MCFILVKLQNPIPNFYISFILYREGKIVIQVAILWNGIVKIVHHVKCTSEQLQKVQRADVFQPLSKHDFHWHTVILQRCCLIIFINVLYLKCTYLKCHFQSCLHDFFKTNHCIYHCKNGHQNQKPSYFSVRILIFLWQKDMDTFVLSAWSVLYDTAVRG